MNSTSYMHQILYIAILSAIHWAAPRVDPLAQANCPTHYEVVNYHGHDHHFLVIPHTPPKPFHLQVYQSYVWVWVYDTTLQTNSAFDAPWACAEDVQNGGALRLIRHRMYGESVR